MDSRSGSSCEEEEDTEPKVAQMRQAYETVPEGFGEALSTEAMDAVEDSNGGTTTIGTIFAPEQGRGTFLSDNFLSIIVLVVVLFCLAVGGLMLYVSRRVAKKKGTVHCF